MFDIKILESEFIRGPSIYSYKKSVLKIIIDIGNLEDHPSNHFPDLGEKLKHYLPGLENHECDGGFMNRIKKGTYMGHILEHMALEFRTVMTMLNSGFGRTREIPNRRGVYRITISCFDEKFGRQCIEEARHLLLAVLNGQENKYCLKTSLKNIYREMVLNIATIHILDYAYNLSLPTILLYKNLVQLNYGHSQKRIWAGYGHDTSHISIDISSDKNETKEMISMYINVPEGKVCTNPSEAIELLKDAKDKSFVVKPLDGQGGQCVFTDVTTKKQLLEVYRKIESKGFSPILVEEMLQGTHHRVLVLGNEIVGVLKSKEVYVEGDGVSTIQQLTDSQINGRVDTFHHFNYTIIEYVSSSFPQYKFQLEKHGKTPHSILKKNEKIRLGYNGTFTGKDILDELHPLTKKQILTAVHAIGLDIAGVDLIAKDISVPLDEQGGGVCEINAKPSWSDHILYPSRIPFVEKLVTHHVGTSFNVIPIIGLVGNTLPFSFFKELHNALSTYHSFQYIGSASKHGVFVNLQSNFMTNDMFYDEAQKVLIHPDVDIAIIQCNFPDMERNGLPYLNSRILIIDHMDDDDDDNKWIGVPMDALSSEGILFVKDTVNINHNLKNYYSYKNTTHLMQLFQKIKI